MPAASGAHHSSVRSRTTRRFAVIALGLVLLALAVRVVVVAATPDFHPRTDAADYDAVAVSLAQNHRFPQTALAGGGASAFRPPVFPLVLAGVYAVGGSHSATGRWQRARLVEAALGALTVALIGLIALQVWGQAVALLAMGMAAIYPPLVLAGSSLLSESVFLPLLLGAVAAALTHRRSPHRYRWAMLAGALAGLAALTRSNGALVLIPLAVALLGARPRLSRAGIAPVAVMLACFAGVMLPWTIRNAEVLHAFVPVSTQDGFVLAGIYNDVAKNDHRYPALWRPPSAVPAYDAIIRRSDLGEAQVNDRLRQAALRFVKRHPSYLFTAGYQNLRLVLILEGRALEQTSARYLGIPLWLSDAGVYGFWIVGILALLGAMTLAARRTPAFLWLVPALMLLSIVFISGLARYRLPADPFLVMLAALAIAAASHRRALSADHGR